MIKSLIISRTDSLGDVVLTLPMAGVLKKIHPEIKIFFLGRSYTQPIIETCEHVDQFINWDEISTYSYPQKIVFFSSLNADAIVHVFPNRELSKIAFESKIPLRIGTSHRPYHWLYCNKIIPVGRKKSNLHEAQLNLKLLISLGAEKNYTLKDIGFFYGLSRLKPVEDHFKSLLDKNRFNLILHPKSKGSGREWNLDNFGELIRILPKEKYKIFISGTDDDKKQLTKLFELYGDDITDITGQMNLNSFISFIHEADGLIASSTGPLHISAALGKLTIGLFPPIRPNHPGRWSPVGEKASFLVIDKNCNKCRNTNICECINQIKPEQVLRHLEEMRISKV